MTDIAPDTAVVMGWQGPIMALDVWCGELDRRIYHDVEWPDLPRSMGSSHFSDESVGTVDEIEILTAADGTRYVWGRGRFSNTDAGVKAATQVAEGSLRTVSVEPRDGEFAEWEMLDDQGELTGWATEWSRMVIGAFALERNPAFAGAVIVPDGEAAAFVYDPPAAPNPADSTAPDDGARPESDPVEVDGELAQRAAAVAAMRTLSDPAVVRAAGAGPVPYPAGHFARVDLGAPTRLTISPDGEVLGHVAVWGRTHRSDGRWLAAPCGDLSEFLVGAAALDDGRTVPAGVLVSDGLHAPAHQAGANADTVRRLIESTATQVAQVTAWEDDHGMAVHGHLLPGVGPDLATRAMAGCPSIDQRDLGDGRGFLTMGVLCVNTCGFKPGEAMVEMADGEPIRRLVASAVPDGCGCGSPGGSCSCPGGHDTGPAEASTAPTPGRLAAVDRAMDREALRSVVAGRR